MSEPLTLDDLKRELAGTETRIEKKIDERFDDLTLAVADVITRVNDHGDERLDRLEKVLQVKDRVDRIEVLLAEKFGRDTLMRAGL